MTQTTVHPDAAEVAAKATGLRVDQIQRAVEIYREAANGLEAEPEWQAIMHMGGQDIGLHQYRADDTAVTLQVESWTEHGNWRQVRYYLFEGTPYDNYAEARAIELKQSTRPKPYRISTESTP